MTITSGLRSGLRTSIRSGLNPSGSAATWTSDATSSKAIPANATEGNALLAAASVSGSVVAIYNFGAATASPVADDVGAKDLTGTGTLTFEQAVTGWAAKSVKTTAGAPGVIKNAADFDDISTTPYTIVLVAELAAIGFTGTIFRMGDVFDDDAVVEQTAAPLLSCGEGDATRTAGASNPLGVRIIMLSIGASVLVATDQEKITVGTRACNGDELLFGGDNAQTNLPGNTKYVHAYVIDSALTFTQMKALMTSSGWTPPWSP